MPGRLAPAARSVDEIETASFPTDSTQMRTFWGPCNVYRRFIEDFSTINRPLNDYLRKNKKFNWSDPTAQAQYVFNMFKSKLAKPPVLVLLQPHRPNMTDTDVAVYAFGAAFIQQQSDRNLM